MARTLPVLLGLHVLTTLHGQTYTTSSAVRFGGSGTDAIRSMTVDASGNTYLCGFFQGTADLDPGPAVHNRTSNGANDGYVMKVGTDGSAAWVVTFGGTQGDGANAVAVDGAGNVVVAGFFTGTVDMDPGPGETMVSAGGNDDMVLAKYDANGMLLWATATNTTGGNSGYGMDLAPNGDIVVGGVFFGTTDFDGSSGVSNATSVGNGDAYLVKYNANGAFQWVLTTGGTARDEVEEVSIDASGNIHFAGTFNGTADIDFGAAVVSRTSAGSSDVFVGKLGPGGDVMWTVAYGGTGEEYVYGLDVGTSGRVTIGGYFAAAVDMDPGAGITELTSTSNSDVNGFVQRLDADGAFEWAGAFRSAGGSTLFDLDHLADDHVLVCGGLYGTMDVDPGTGVTNINSGSFPDGFVARLDADGGLVRHFQFNGADYDDITGVVGLLGGAVRCAGGFYSTADLNGADDPAPLVSAGGLDGFILTLDAAVVGIQETTAEDIEIIVEPLNRTVQVRNNGAPGPYALHELTGRMIGNGTLRTGSTTIDMQRMPTGVYILRTERGTRRFVLP